MPKLVIINGAPGIGKTTVAEVVFSKLPNSALLDGDDVWRVNPFEVNDRTKAVVERNIPFVLRSYLDAGYEYVLLTWVMHKQEIIDRVVGSLDGLDFGLHVFTLVAEEGVLCERWRDRAGRNEAPALVMDRLRESRRLETTLIETSDMSPEQVAEEILASIGSG